MQTKDKLELFHSWPPTDVLFRVSINQTEALDVCLIYYCSYCNNQDKNQPFQPFCTEMYDVALIRVN